MKNHDLIAFYHSKDTAEKAKGGPSMSPRSPRS
jgi:hypothetical protein